MISWNRDLETARTAREVLDATRDFLAAFPAEGLASLPREHRPRDIVGSDDIRDWSRRLTDEYWRERNAGGELSALHEMWSFFLRASIQLARLDAAARERAYGRQVARA